MRLQIPKLTSAKTIIRRPASPLFRTAATWPRDVTYLRKVYADIHSRWSTDSDERLYSEVEPRVREMLIGLDKVASQMSHRPDIFLVSRNIKKDFKLAEIYAREKDYPAAITRLSYSLMTFCGALNGLDKIAMKKIAYGYDVTGEVMEPGEVEGRSPNLWDQGNSPKFDHTSNNPANQMVDSEAENEYPEELEHKNEKVKWPARTR